MTTTTPITTPTTSTAMRPPQAPAGQPILVAQGLTKAYQGNTVLHGVDLQIREREFIAVMGPSGSGKSTLLYTISGMDRMTSGSVQFAGEELADLSQKQLSRLRLTRMGFIFQHVYLLKNLTLLDNVVLPAFLAKLAPRAELAGRTLTPGAHRRRRPRRPGHLPGLGRSAAAHRDLPGPHQPARDHLR